MVTDSDRDSFTHIHVQKVSSCNAVHVYCWRPSRKCLLVYEPVCVCVRANVRVMCFVRGLAILCLMQPNQIAAV